MIHLRSRVTICPHNNMSTEEEEELDNDEEALEKDRARFDAMLRALDQALCVVEVQRRAGGDWFLLHSHSLRYRAQIQAWVDDNLSAVRYRLVPSRYTASEMELVRGQPFSLIKTRATLALVREAYAPLNCPRLATFCSLLLHLGALALALMALYHLVTL